MKEETKKKGKKEEGKKGKRGVQANFRE